MKVLLTGGAGFIGSHTAIELLEAGHDVVIADNFSNSKLSVLDSINVLTGITPKLYQIDVTDQNKVNEMFSCEKPDAVVHFAGFKSVGESVAKPMDYYRNNIDSVITVLNAMVAYKTKTLVFSSSATVYGDPATLPITEDMLVGNCSNPYGRTKYFIEEICKDALIAHPELNIVLLRYFNPVGSHKSGLLQEKPNGIPNNLMPYIVQTAQGIREQLHVFGNDYDTPDGTGVRDYIHVVDLAKGHVAALNHTLTHPGLLTYNLGTGVGYSVLDIVKAFEKAHNIKLPYVIDPRRPGDIASCYADPTKAREELGWEAKYGIDDIAKDSWNEKGKLI